jgi:type II secretory pathway component GspD/PulD (secretin)
MTAPFAAVVARRPWRASALLLLALSTCGCGANEPARPTGLVDAPLFSPSITDLFNQPATRRAQTDAEPQVIPQGEKSILIYTAHHAPTESLREAVATVLNPDGTVQDSVALNALIVQDQPDTITSVLAMLKALDHPTPQLLVEARVVEVTVTDDLEYEIQHTLTVPNSPSSFFQNSEIKLQTPGASPTVGEGAQLKIRPFGSGDKTLEDFVRLLQTKGKAHILSSPNLIVAPGTEGSIITGQEVPIQTQTVVAGSISTSTVFKNVGIKLRVTLHQITDDTARLDINPEVSTVTGASQVSLGVSVPIISLRNVTSTVALKDGEILTIGGLLDDQDQHTTMGIPLLQDIPYAGHLFQSIRNQKTRSQIIFFLRIHILQPSDTETLRLHRPGVGFEALQPATTPANPGPQTQPSLEEITTPNTDHR